MIPIIKQTQGLFEQQIVQDMSKFFKLFKNQLLTIEKILVLNYRDDFETQSPEEVQQMQLQLKSVLKQEQKIIQKLALYNKYLQIFKMLFCRLFNRFAQMIHFYKKKQTNTKQDFFQFCRKIQIIIYNAISNESTNYLQILIQLCEIGKRFIIKHLNYSDKSQFQEIIFDKSNQTNLNQVKCDIIRVPNKYQNKLNEFYQNLKPIQIDYQTFKNGFYNSRSQQNQLYNQIYGRNKFINQEIIAYRKSYGFYKLRKNKHNSKIRPRNISLVTSILRKISSNKTKESQTSNTSSYNPQTSVHSQDMRQILSSKILERKKKKNYIESRNFNKTQSNGFQQKDRKVVKHQQNYFKISSKNSNEFKRITLKMQKFSLKSQQKQQRQFNQIIKKKYTVFCNNKKRTKQKFVAIIQGHKINQTEIRNSQLENSLQKQTNLDLF